jgi:hypothetical protein
MQGHNKKELKKAITKGKAKKAPGPDDIPNEAIIQLDNRNREKL